MYFPSDLLIFSTPSMPSRIGSVRMTSGSWPYEPLDFARHEQVELLLRGADLDVGVQRHRVVALRKRIHELNQTDGASRFVAFFEIVRAPSICANRLTWRSVAVLLQIPSAPASGC
jgi:hypothetical protein